MHPDHLPSPAVQQSWLPAPNIKHWYYHFNEDIVHDSSMETYTWAEVMRFMRNDWNQYNTVHIDWLELGYAV